MLTCSVAVQAMRGYRFGSPEAASLLTGHYINAILRDSYGFLWVATESGLYQFDGYKAHVYAVADSAGNADTNIIKIEEDEAGQMWVTTYNGIYRYDRERDTVWHDCGEYLSELGIIAPAPEMVEVDNELNLWCASGDMLYYYNFAAATLYSMPLAGAHPVSADCRKGHGSVLLSDGSVATVNWTTRKLNTIGRIKVSTPSNLRLYVDASMRVWAFDRLGAKVVCYSAATGEMLSVPVQLGGKLIKAVAGDNDGNLWVGTNNDGIVVVYGSNENDIVNIMSDNNKSLSSNHINCLYYDDKDDAMWVGTSRHGIACCRLGSTGISVHDTKCHEEISCFIEDNDSSLLIGFDGKGLGVLGNDGSPMKLYNTANSDLQSDLMVGMYAGRGRLWLGSYGGGVAYVQDGALHKLHNDTLAFVRHICEDSQGNTWIGTFSAGLHRCDSTLGNFATYDDKNSCLKTNCITGLCYDEKSHSLYVATSTGLYVVDTGTGRMECAAENDTLANLNISCMVIDSRGLVWLGTTNGIMAYSGSERMVLRHLSEADGLQGNRIHALAIDHSGNIWASTATGVSNIIVDRGEDGGYVFSCLPYYENDWAEKIPFSKYAIYCTGAGKILVGGLGKYIEIDPDHIKVSLSGRVMFTDLYIDHAAVSPGDDTKILDRPLYLCDKITVDDIADLVVEVSAMNYHYKRVKYVYRLDDGTWSEADGNRIALDGLRRGLHRLQVKVAGSQVVSTLEIEVGRSFWASPLAVVLYALLGGVAVVVWWLRRLPHRGQTVAEKTDNVQSSSANKQFLEKAMSIAEANIDNSDFSIEDFGAQMGMSRSNLYKRMMAVTGKSPLDFLRDIRLKRGLELLDGSDLGISQIAYSIGLSPKQFSKVFKEVYGCLPSQYRKMPRGGGAAV